MAQDKTSREHPEQNYLPHTAKNGRILNKFCLILHHANFMRLLATILAQTLSQAGPLQGSQVLVLCKPAAKGNTEAIVNAIDLDKPSHVDTAIMRAEVRHKT